MLWKQTELAGPFRDQITTELLLLHLLVHEFPECAGNPETQLLYLSVTRGMASPLVANKYEALDVGRSVRLTVT